MRTVCALFLVICGVLAGCGGDQGPACEPGSIRVHVTLDGAAAGADLLQITVGDDQAPELLDHFPHQPGEAGDVFDISLGHPFDGKQHTFTLRAFSGSDMLGLTSFTYAPGGQCGALDLNVRPQ